MDRRTRGDDLTLQGTQLRLHLTRISEDLKRGA